MDAYALLSRGVTVLDVGGGEVCDVGRGARGGEGLFVWGRGGGGGGRVLGGTVVVCC
jgi:hypothetical protein